MLSGENSIVLHCYRFSQQKPEVVLTVALPLPYNVQHYLRGETYYASPLALTLPIQEINMQILHLQKCLWCVCLQHSNGVACRRAANSDHDTADLPEDGKLDYTVFIFNSGHMLHMQVPLPMPVVEPIDIHFMVLSGFVVAYVPNFLLHVLNVGPTSDPCHHLAFSPEQTPRLPSSENAAETPSTSEILISSAIATTIQTQNISTVIDHRSGSHYEITINASALLELFKSTTSMELMEDLLHLTVVGLRHHGMALAMMEHVCQTPIRLGDHRLFSEFLLAFTFANTVFNSHRFVSKHFPLTTSPTFCGKVFKNTERVTFAMLRLNSIRKFIVQLLVQSDQRLVKASPNDLLNHEVGDNPFEMLCFVAVTSQPSRPRINLLQEIESQDKHSLLSSRPLPPAQSTSQPPARPKKVRKSEPTSSGNTLLNRLSQFTRSSFQPHGPQLPVDVNHRDMLPFLEPDTDQEDEVAEQKEILMGAMAKFMSGELSTRSKATIAANMRLYIVELEKQSCLLLRVLWDALGFTAKSNPLSHGLHRPPTALEEILFERLETYQLAHQEIGFPTPAGFHTLFATLGFICLPDAVFLQYLRNGVFVPTKAFVERLVQEVGHWREEVVYEVVCHSNPQLASHALQMWQNTIIKTLLPEHTAPPSKRT